MNSDDDTPAPASRPGFWKRRVVQPIVAQLTQGVTPAELSKAVAVGAVGGVFPILGTTSIFAGLVALVFRLNQAVVQSVTVVLYPLHLLMIPVYIRAGEWLFGAPPVAFSVSEALGLFARSPAGFFAEFGMTCVHCVTAWAVSALPLTAAVVFLVRPLLEKAARRVRKSRPSPPPP